MSNSLVKKSLQLFDDGEFSGPSTSTEKKKKKTTDPMKLISTRRKGVKKELLKLQRQKMLRGQAKPKPTSSALELYLSQQPTDKTKASIRMLQKLSTAGRTDGRVSKLILDHHGKQFKREKLRKKGKVKPKVDETPIFTDADFANFEKEYDF